MGFNNQFTSEVHRRIERAVTRTIVVDMTTARGARKRSTNAQGRNP